MGLKVNYEKTEALWIRSFKNRTDKLAIKQNIKWTFRKVKSLGVWFSTSVEEAAVLNYQEKKEKISKILNCWQVRRINLLGKITVIKSLAASQVVYIMSPLPSSQSYLKEIHQILYNFLWECESVQKFWQNIQYWLIQHQVKPQHFSLNLPTCLGLVDNTEDILLHYALLTGRYHIYSSKIKKTLPNLHIFSQTFLKCQEIEKCFAYKTNAVKKYNSKWNRFK